MAWPRFKKYCFLLPFSDRDNRFPHRSQIQFDAKKMDLATDAMDQLSAEMDRVLQRRYTVCFYKKLIHLGVLKVF